MSLVSVIVPCYNQGEFLGEALQSLVNQSHTSWECIVVNDGSTDNTAEVAQRWLQKENKRLRVITKQNGGLSSARNAGLEAAHGAYVQFLDADDLLEPKKLERQLNDLRLHPPGTIAVCDHFPFDYRTGEYVADWYVSPSLNAGNFKRQVITEWEFRRSIPCHNLLIPASLLRNHSLRFNESLPNHEDWVMWCSLFYFATGLCWQPEKLTRYRMRHNSLTRQKEEMAKGFLAATFALETFYVQAGEPTYVSCVRKIRKEIKNNLFEHSAVHNLYAEFKQLVKKKLMFP